MGASRLVLLVTLWACTVTGADGFTTSTSWASFAGPLGARVPCRARASCATGGSATAGDALGGPAAATRRACRVERDAGELRMIGGDGGQVKQILREYGVAALGTHFFGWTICMSTVYTLLGWVGPENIIHALPEGMQEHIDLSKAMGLVKLQASLAATEAIGPIRLGITLTITPTVSRVMRKYKATRNLEALCVRSARKVVRGVKREGEQLLADLKGIMYKTSG